MRGPPVAASELRRRRRRQPRLRRKRRCLPSFANAWNEYADAACTQRVVEAGAACPPAWGATWDSPACSTTSRVHLYPVIGQHTGPVYTLSGTSCTAASASTSAHFLLGAETPAADLVPITEALR